MKRLLKAGLAVFMAFALTISPKALSSNAANKLALAEQSIHENIVTLYEKAKSVNARGNTAFASLEDGAGNSYDIPQYKIDTSDLTSSFVGSNTKSITYIANTSDYMRSRGNNTEGGYDGSYSVYGYVTIYYTTTGTNPDRILLTSVSGGYTIADSQVSVTNQLVKYGCNGNEVYNQDASFNTTSSSWSRSTGFTRYVEVVDLDYSSFVVGCNSKITFRRGNGGSYNFTVVNNY